MVAQVIAVYTFVTTFLAVMALGSVWVGYCDER